MNDLTSLWGGARVVTLGIFTILVAGSATAQPRWGRPTAPQSGACFYRDVNFEGDYFCAGAGEDIPVMPNGMNDQVSSVRIYGDVEVSFGPPRPGDLQRAPEESFHLPIGTPQR